MLKHCRGCKADLPLSAFIPRPNGRQYAIGTCAACLAKKGHAYREANLERIRAYDRLRANLPHRVKSRRQPPREVISAYNKIQYALAHGRIQRPGACDRCLKRCKPQAHHDDHRKPLVVMWLCSPCHAIRHAELGRIRRTA